LRKQIETIVSHFLQIAAVLITISPTQSNLEKHFQEKECMLLTYSQISFLYMIVGTFKSCHRQSVVHICSEIAAVL
jgi:hypothetical protein